MGELDDHLEALRETGQAVATSCPWLTDRSAGKEYTQYGEKGALCKPGEKVAAGRAASSAYGLVRHLEFDHLPQCRDILREELSRRSNLADESGRFLTKDLFEKCEEIVSCIDCSCDSAVSAYHNLSGLIEILSTGRR
jgi:hypothetical protein